MMRRTDGYEYIIRINEYWIPNVYLVKKKYFGQEDNQGNLSPKKSKT